MPQIVIENINKKVIDIEDTSKTVLQHVQANNIDWMHACGGKGRCTTCAFTVQSGMDFLEPKTTLELKFEKMGALLVNQRLACQAKGKGKGNIIISVPKENQLPHISYKS